MKEWQAAIKREIKKYGLTQTQIAKRANVGEATLSRWLKEGSSENPKITSIRAVLQALRDLAPDIPHYVPAAIEESFREQYEAGNERREIDEGQYTLVPKMKAYLHGGEGRIVEDESAAEMYAFRTEWIRSKGSRGAMKLMEVRGDSMEPTIRDGDIVLLDSSENTPLHDRLMAVGIGSSILVKRVIIKVDGIELRPDNKEHEPLFLTDPDQARFIGVVIWRGGEV